MENNQNNLETEKNQLEFSVSDFLHSDSPEFSFKPINDGLGFHKESEIRPMRSNTNSFQEYKSTARVEIDSINRINNYRGNPNSAAQVSSQGLSRAKSAKSKKELVTKGEQHLGASFFAGVIDILVVSFSTIIFFRALSTLASFYEVKMVTADLKLYWPYVAISFSLIWLAYSTLMSPGQTIGQSLAGLKLKFSHDPYLSSFIRSLVVLGSFICFGIPLFFDFQGKLSDTELVNE